MAGDAGPGSKAGSSWWSTYWSAEWERRRSNASLTPAVRRSSSDPAPRSRRSMASKNLDTSDITTARSRLSLPPGNSRYTVARLQPASRAMSSSVVLFAPHRLMHVMAASTTRCSSAGVDATVTTAKTVDSATLRRNVTLVVDETTGSVCLSAHRSLAGEALLAVNARQTLRCLDDVSKRRVKRERAA